MWEYCDRYCNIWNIWCMKVRLINLSEASVREWRSRLSKRYGFLIQMIYIMAKKWYYKGLNLGKQPVGKLREIVLSLFINIKPMNEFEPYIETRENGVQDAGYGRLMRQKIVQIVMPAVTSSDNSWNIYENCFIRLSKINPENGLLGMADHFVLRIN